MFGQIRSLCNGIGVAVTVLAANTLPAIAHNEPIPEHLNQRTPLKISSKYESILKFIQSQKWKITGKHKQQSAKTVIFFSGPTGNKGIEEINGVRLRTLGQRIARATYCIEGVEGPESQRRDSIAARKAFSMIVGRDPTQLNELEAMRDRMAYNQELFNSLRGSKIGIEPKDESLTANAYVCLAVADRLVESAESIKERITKNEEYVLKIGDEWQKPFRNIMRTIDALEREYKVSMPKLDGEFVTRKVGEDGIERTYANSQSEEFLKKLSIALNDLYKSKILPRRNEAMAADIQKYITSKGDSEVFIVYGAREHFLAKSYSNSIAPIQDRFKMKISYIIIDISQK